VTLFSDIEKDLQEAVKRQLQVQKAAKIVGTQIQEVEAEEVTPSE
jgi:hypothetical protein